MARAAVETVRVVTDEERRARLARRHALHPDHRRDSVEAVVQAMTVLHATEAASVHLAVAARSDTARVADVERALYDDRTVVKQLAMRRTLFVFSRDLLGATLASSSARVAATERPRHAAMLEKAGVTDDGVAWFVEAEAAVLETLADGEPRTAAQLRALLPEWDAMVDPTPEKSYSRPGSVMPWILTHLAASGELVRARNAGHWRINKPTWTSMSAWLGSAPTPPPAREGYAELVRRWLWTFGPGSVEDVQWWLGDTKTTVRAALEDLGAVAVSLESGEVGWLLPDDVDEVEPVPPYAVLLPVLDPTVMGWKTRGFYLADPPRHTDRAGNIGTTASWDGRVVGTWVQAPDGRVLVATDHDVPPAARAALDAEAERLTAWLDGDVVVSLYSSEAMKAAKAHLL